MSSNNKVNKGSKKKEKEKKTGKKQKKQKDSKTKLKRIKREPEKGSSSNDTTLVNDGKWVNHHVTTNKPDASQPTKSDHAIESDQLMTVSSESLKSMSYQHVRDNQQQQKQTSDSQDVFNDFISILTFITNPHRRMYSA